ncbi:tRNA pseudouridine synthase A-like protein [Leptotrombidium deliense]|uniref:Pseudouridylate synthase 1 homolog n=1 Tax=Leptotrombidium deliense TaxID=299467 RepID=A0A443SDB1_9ACAR|nr:tRNA pseudouridine synthase A-like protein [Leptotrombidium deliense]
MNTSVKRLKLKKYAILISYCGAGYYGLQRNQSLPTIESELLDAFLKSEVITKEQHENPWTIYFQKASRTDKGVSALKQVLSCHLPPNFCEKISQINEYLPEKIRVVSAKKATRYFDSKSYCEARTYNYLMPTYALCPPEELTCEAFRITPELIKRFNELLTLYKGTHNFHNFTSQKYPTDASAMRYIMEMECGEPFEIDGLQLVVIRIKGQSFMLHQIRKMIGLAIGIMRGFANEDVIERSFGFERLDIPKAPGLGLMLDEVHYDKYNQRYASDGIHEGLNWSEYADFLHNFKHKYIYSSIVETEKNEHQMISWLQTLPMHTFGIRERREPKREMTPEEAIIRELQSKGAEPSTDYTKAIVNSGEVFGENRLRMKKARLNEENNELEAKECNDETTLEKNDEIKSEIENDVASKIERENEEIAR